MFKYIFLLSLLCTTLIHFSVTLPTTSNRRVRSIWPFFSTESEEEASAKDLISAENVLLLKQAGLEKKLNFSSHPVWKIHRYQGIDLKPVYIQTETSRSSVKFPETETTESPKIEQNTTEPLDLSFLGDLGALSYFLPASDDIDFNTTNFLEDAIKNEEESRLSFFEKFWRKIWGAPEKSASKEKSSFFSSWFNFGKNEEPAKSEIFEIYLPETQGSYAAVMVPEKGSQEENVLLPIPTEDAPELFQEIGEKSLPANHANQFKVETAAKSDQLLGMNAKPIEVRLRPSTETSSTAEFSRLKPWVQSWNSQVPVEGAIVQTTSTRASTERKTSEDEVEVVTAVSQVQERDSETVRPENQESEAKPVNVEATINRDDFERAREILSKYNLPESIMRKLQISQQDVDDVLNNKESASKSVERLKAMQREFEKRKEQLIYAYPSLRKHLPK